MNNPGSGSGVIEFGSDSDIAEEEYDPIYNHQDHEPLGLTDPVGEEFEFNDFRRLGDTSYEMEVVDDYDSSEDIIVDDDETGTARFDGGFTFKKPSD